MMKKKIIAILSLTMCLSLSACGDNNAEPTSAITKTDAIQLFIDAVTAPYVNDYNKGLSSGDSTNDSSTTNSEGLTIDEAVMADYEYMLSQGYDDPVDYENYAISQGADAAEGAWWIYYYGEGSNQTERSYAINQRTGEKIVAGPDTYFYGSDDELGSTPFEGGSNIFPGDPIREDLRNHALKLGMDPATYLDEY